MAVRYSCEVEAFGADGLMVVLFYYYTLIGDEIFEYYCAILEVVLILIMFYNNFVMLNVDMLVQFVGWLMRELGNVCYIKEVSFDVARVYDVVEEMGGVMNVFVGERIVELFLFGVVGYVNLYGNYILCVSMFIWELFVVGWMEDVKCV